MSKPVELAANQVPSDSVAKERAPLSFLHKFFYVLREQRRRLFVMVGIFVMMSGLDLLGVGLVGPYIGAVVDPKMLNRFPQIQQYMAAFGTQAAQSQIVILGLLLILVFLVKGVAGYCAQRYVFSFSFHFRTFLVNKLMNSYMYMPYRFYLERNSSTIIQSVLANTKVMADDLLIPSLRLCSDLLILVFMGVFLFWVSPQAMVLLAVLLGSAIFVYLRIVKPRVRLAGEVTAVANERVIRGVNQAIGGIKEIRTLRTEQHFLKEIGTATNDCSTAQSGFMGLLILPKFLMEMALVFFVILFSMYVTWEGQARDSLVTILAMFGVAGIRILPALSQVSSSLVSMSYSSYALNEVYQDLSYAEAYSTQNIQSRKEILPHSDFRKAELHDIQFAYDQSARPTIDGITLSIERGQSIGLIGESGAGKTTLVDILLGLHPFNAGTFRIDGVDIGNYGWENWRDHIAYIPQNAFLIDDTLERNIAFGQSDEHIDRSKIRDAIESAQLTALVERLPEGLQTVLGERGIRLSGGERQRIALARAFYSGRDILILDEATSALDNDTERQVVEVIEGLHGKITLIVIAHRLTTVRSCDVIHRLEKGRIVASGKFEDVTA